MKQPNALGVGTGVGDALGVGDTLGFGVGEALGVGDALGVGAGDVLGVGDGSGVGVIAGVGECEGGPEDCDELHADKASSIAIARIEVKGDVRTLHPCVSGRIQRPVTGSPSIEASSSS